VSKNKAKNTMTFVVYKPKKKTPEEYNVWFKNWCKIVKEEGTITISCACACSKGENNEQ